VSALSGFWNCSVLSFSTLYACTTSGVIVEPMELLGGVWWLLCFALIPTGWLIFLMLVPKMCRTYKNFETCTLLDDYAASGGNFSPMILSQKSASNFRIYTVYYPRRVDMSSFLCFSSFHQHEPHFTLRAVPSKSFHIHYSLIIIYFDPE
jgi:hypothetical protein